MAEHQLLERPFEASFVTKIKALADEIFGTGTIDAADLSFRLAEMPDATVQVAVKDARVVAFKFGYAMGRDRYLSWLGGVAKSFRRQGIARALLERQHTWALNHGYTVIETGTTKDNVAMLTLNLSVGFEIIGTYTRDSSPRVILQKRLVAA
jgi:GNAT superfamily N-acetyltransferase